MSDSEALALDNDDQITIVETGEIATALQSYRETDAGPVIIAAFDASGNWVILSSDEIS